MKRADKISLLKRVLAGQTAELEKFYIERGRLYTEEERAAQQTYLTSLLCHEATLDDVARLFGNFDLSEVIDP
jgi:hypothetical protein